MMLTKVVSSEQARNQWRDIIDAAVAGESIIIERYGKPTAAVISFQDFAAIQGIIEDMRDAREAEAALRVWEDDPTTARPWLAVRAELVSEGRLDE